MANIRPFRCIRPEKEVASKVAALPYDVYDRKEAKQEVEKNPLSFLAVDRAEVLFDDEVAASDPRVYQKARERMDEWQRNGTLISEESDCYYIYELTRNGRAQTGVVACASIDDYLSGVIAKHENTREDKELDRIHHLEATDAHTGPIFMAYRADEEIREIVTAVKQTEALYDFVAEDGVGHRVWSVENIDEGTDTVANKDVVARLTACFARIPRLYIADGHHRAAAAVKVGLKHRAEQADYTGEEPFNYFLSVLFPDDELTILPYNRVVKDLNGLSETEFLEMVEERFEVRRWGECRGEDGGCGTGITDGAVTLTTTDAPVTRHHIGMYLAHCWYELILRLEYVPENPDDPVKNLDVTILQDLLLNPVLGIKDVRTDQRIRFVGGIRGLAELKRLADKNGGVAFSMYPTSIQELFAVADAGLLMPPKSTWFEPKLRSGLFIHKLS